MKINKQYRRYAFVVGAAAGTLTGVVACGSSFGSSDCKASRTCGAPTPVAGAAGASPDDEALAGGSAASNAAGQAGGDATTGDATGAGGADSDPHVSNPGGGGNVPAGAGGGEVSNSPPTVTAIVPADAATKVDPDATVVVTFSEPLDAATVTAANIKLFDGGTEVKGKLSYADGKVTFTPTLPLHLLAPFKLTVSSAVTGVQGAALQSAYTASFTTRDGAWKTIDAARGSMTGLSEALPLTATGDALLAWTETAGGGCPASARWFRRATVKGGAQVLDPTNQDCTGVAAGGNAAGIAAVAWQVPDVAAGELASQFRAGAWSAHNAVVTSDTTIVQARAAVSPTGMVTIIGHQAGGGMTAWRTDTAGKWVAKADSLSDDQAFSAASISFDAAGNGLAVWSAQPAKLRTEMLFSKYTTASGKWSIATAIPDSVTMNVNERPNDGPPTVVMTPDGDAMAVWMQSNGDVGTQVNTSVYSHLSGWASDADEIMPYLSYDLLDAPALTFDGQAFVAAWVAKPLDPTPGFCGTAFCTYANRYELKSSKWGDVVALPAVKSDIAAARMPRLASDGRGTSLLVWAKAGAGGTFSLVYQRYQAGNWSAITALPGGTVTNSTFLSSGFFGLAMNASGMAALSWADYDSNNLIAAISLASFY